MMEDHEVQNEKRRPEWIKLSQLSDTGEKSYGVFTLLVDDATSWLKLGGYNAEYQKALLEWFISPNVILGSVFDCDSEVVSRANLESFIIYAIRENLAGEVYCSGCSCSYPMNSLSMRIVGGSCVDNMVYCPKEHLVFKSVAMHISFKKGFESFVDHTVKEGQVD